MDDKRNNPTLDSLLPSSQIAPPASLTLLNSAQNIPLLSTLAESAACLSSTSSPSVYNTNNNLGTDQQHCSPSVNSNSSRKKVLSRSGTPSSSNASLHLKINTPKSTAEDVYEFQSSPEEDNVSGSGFFFTSVPNSGVFHVKTSTTIQRIENQQPPQKRIKTAILAKKLLAAAADSNIIDSVALAQPTGHGTLRRSTTDGHGGTNLEDVQKETEGVGEGLFEEDEEEADNEEQEERELDDDQAQQQNEERMDASASVVVQEQKKVPPLRISLLKTPSEEGADASSTQISPPLRKNKGGTRVAGRRQGYSSKKDELQRITRSRVRQIATDPTMADGISLLGRKRRFRPVMPGNSSGLLEEEEEDAMSGTAEAMENAGEEEQRSRTNEDQRSEEDSRHSATGNRTTDGTGEANVEDSLQQQRHSVSASVLSKNSLEQSVTFEAMIREKWALQYKEYLSNITEKMESADLTPHQLNQPQEVLTETDLLGTDMTKKDWPESLQKLYSEQLNRSREMTEAHRQDRERIRTMMQREMAKATNAAGEKQTHFITAVSMLRDSECYDPAVFVEGTTGRSSHVPSITHTQQRFNYLVTTTRNRHAMEAHTLGENHKTEWKRALRKIARENERHQMLKGGGGIGRPQLIHLSSECYSDSLIPVVKLVDIPLLVSIQNGE